MATRMALSTMSKGTSSMSEYFVKMKGLAGEMASAGKKLEDDELVTFIVAGLGEDYESIITAITSYVEPIFVNELYAQLVAFEQRRDLHGSRSQSSANIATKGGRGRNSSNYQQRNHGGDGNRGDAGRGGFRCGGGGRGNGGRGHNGSGNNRSGGGGRNFLVGVFCQLCNREGHMVVRCFRRFHTNFTGPPQKSMSSTNTASYGVDTNWYVDSDGTDHITSELEKLSSGTSIMVENKWSRLMGPV